jgi:hypothetical protein
MTSALFAVVNLFILANVLRGCDMPKGVLYGRNLWHGHDQYSLLVVEFK